MSQEILSRTPMGRWGMLTRLLQPSIFWQVQNQVTSQEQNSLWMAAGWQHENHC